MVQDKWFVIEWIDFYNNEQSHSTFDGQTPKEAYSENRKELAA